MARPWLPLGSVVARLRSALRRPPPVAAAVHDLRSGELDERLKELAFAPPSVRREIQTRLGVNVLPVSFYSAAPSIAEIESSFEYRPGSSGAVYLDHELFDHQRLDAVLEELLPFAHELDPPARGEVANPAGYFWENPGFSYSDAMAYYCLIRRHRPRTILEVGSGFSTLLAVEALRRNGTGRLVCIEPYPMPFLSELPEVELVTSTAESLELPFFQEHLGEGDFFFIDSTHTVKSGGDCVHLYLRVLPRLEHDVLVHAHDIFLPYGMPLEWLLEKQLFWTEQYLLLALLTDNPRATMIWSSPYQRNFNTARLEQMMAGKWPVGGGSLWFRYRGRPRPAEA